MNKTIKINANGNDYILEYDRNSVIKMQDLGFDISKIEQISIKQILLLFKGAFIKNHPQTSNKVMEDIYDGITNKQDFIAKLVEMFSDTFTTLFDEPKDEAKKVKWEVNF